jgi:hypothetical protein
LDLVKHPDAEQRFEHGHEYKGQWSVCSHEVKYSGLFNDAANCYVFMSSAIDERMGVENWWNHIDREKPSWA